MTDAVAIRRRWLRLADGRYVAGYPDVVDYDVTFPDGSRERTPFPPVSGRYRDPDRPGASLPFAVVIHDMEAFAVLEQHGLAYHKIPGRPPTADPIPDRPDPERAGRPTRRALALLPETPADGEKRP